MPTIQTITNASGTFPYVPNTRTLTINGVSYDLTADRSWTISTSGTGTVTSVALSATMPTGLVASISGSPITSNGTLGLTLTFQSGYSIPLNTKQSNWDDAYTFVSAFPTQTGNSGKYLTTNGSALSWATLDFANITGTLPVTKGGTGVATLTGVVIGNGTSNFSAITGGPLQLLRVNSSATGYEFFNATFLSNPMIALGDIIYGAGAGTPTRLAGNSTGNKMFLSSTGSGGSATAPLWETIEFTEIVGTLAVNKGGSGATSLTGILVGNGTSAFTALASTTAQQLLRVNTLGTAYEWFTPSFLVSGDINATTPLVWNTGTRTMSIPQANNTTNGFLSSADWLTFSSKQPAITLTTTGNSGASTFNVITGALNIPEYTLIGLGGFANPMTTLGDLIVARNSGEPFRLAGNSTSTRKYLSQIGNGTSVVSTSWEAINAVTGSGTTNYVAKFTSSSAVGNSLIFDNGISVGVGTAAPTYRIEAVTTGTLGFRLQTTSSTVGNPQIDLFDSGRSQETIISSFDGTTVGTYIASFSNHPLLLGTNAGSSATAKMSINTSGDVGIGTPSASAGLHLVRPNGTASMLRFDQTSQRTYEVGILASTQSFTIRDVSASANRLQISNTGQLTLNGYTSTSSFTGVAQGILAFDASGQIITQSNIPQSGNYTPTLYSISNVTGTTAYNCQYIRVGSVVSVSGRLEVDATTASTVTIVEVELPYNTTFANAHQCNGVLTAEDNICGIVLASSTRASLRFTPPNTGSFNYFFTLHFQII